MDELELLNAFMKFRHEYGTNQTPEDFLAFRRRNDLFNALEGITAAINGDIDEYRFNIGMQKYTLFKGEVKLTTVWEDEDELSDDD